MGGYWKLTKKWKRSMTCKSKIPKHASLTLQQLHIKDTKAKKRHASRTIMRTLKSSNPNHDKKKIMWENVYKKGPKCTCTSKKIDLKVSLTKCVEMKNKIKLIKKLNIA